MNCDQGRHISSLSVAVVAKLEYWRRSFTRVGRRTSRAYVTIGTPLQRTGESRGAVWRKRDCCNEGVIEPFECVRIEAATEFDTPRLF